MSAPVPWARFMDMVTLPAADLPRLSPRAYAVTVAGDGVMPFADSDVLVLDPACGMAPGDLVLLWPHDDAQTPVIRMLGALHRIVGVVGRHRRG